MLSWLALLVKLLLLHLVGCLCYWLVFITETDCVYCTVQTVLLNIVYVNLGIKLINFTPLIWMLSVCHVPVNISARIRTNGHVLRIWRGSFALRKIRGVPCQAEELQCTLHSPILDCSMSRFCLSVALQSVLFVRRFQKSVELLVTVCTRVFQTWFTFFKTSLWITVYCFVIQVGILMCPKNYKQDKNCCILRVMEQKMKRLVTAFW